MKLFIGLSILVICLVIALVIWRMSSGSPASIHHHVKKHMDSGQVALVIQRNNEMLVEVNPHEPLPLASTVKFMVAIAYAQAAADGRIDASSPVLIKEIEPFYIPKTDGGAHKAWLGSLEGAKTVPLSEVANGMMLYSSNANTDYLIHRLGLFEINKTIRQLGLQHQEELYPLASSLYIPVQLMDEHGYDKKEVAAAMEQMDIEEYRMRAMQIHADWLDTPPDAEDIKRMQQALTVEVQKVWSDRLPRASAADYAELMSILNSKNHFSPAVHAYLDPITEQLMQNPQNQSWLEHAGQKGGSTMFVLTNAMYATDKQHTPTEIVLLLNDLSLFEQMKLSRSLNEFQLKVLTEPDFLEEVRQTLEPAR